LIAPLFPFVIPAFAPSDIHISLIAAAPFFSRPLRADRPAL
jgi:hypothetical protein